MHTDSFSALDDAVLQEFVWNGDETCSDEHIFHLTDFRVSGVDKAQSLAEILENNTILKLEGMLQSPTIQWKRLRYVAEVENIHVDRGYAGDGDEVKGLWAYGTDNDARFKLLSSPSCKFLCQLFSADGLDPYTTRRLDGKKCIRMENFSLTDALGSAQTLILPSGNAKRYCLRGTVLLPERSTHTQLPRRLPLQTYVSSRYVVDLGDDPFAVHPEFCVEDCHGTWIVLSGPGHPDYAADHAATVQRTIGSLRSYDWPSEGEAAGEDAAGPWRRITNYRLCTDSGEAHHLEVGELSHDASFALWAELSPPPGSPSPPLNIRLRVCQHSIDVGRSLYDPSKGVWVQDLRGDWYMLGAPAAEYARIAQPLLRKARHLLGLTDALLFQDRSDALSTYLPDQRKYQCLWAVRAVHKQAHPKFCLHFVMTNKRFVAEHLSGIFDEDASDMLFSSVRNLQGVPAPPPEPEPVLQDSGAASLPSSKRPRSTQEAPLAQAPATAERTGTVVQAAPPKPPTVLPAAPPKPIAKRADSADGDLRLLQRTATEPAVTPGADNPRPQPGQTAVDAHGETAVHNDFPSPWLAPQEPPRYPSHRPPQVPQQPHQQLIPAAPVVDSRHHWDRTALPPHAWQSAPAVKSHPPYPQYSQYPPYPSVAAARAPYPPRGPGAHWEGQAMPAPQQTAPPRQTPVPPPTGNGHQGVPRAEEFFRRCSATEAGNGNHGGRAVEYALQHTGGGASAQWGGTECNVIDTRQTINARSGVGQRPPLPPQMQPQATRRRSRFDDAVDDVNTPRVPPAAFPLKDGGSEPARPPSASHAPHRTEAPCTAPPALPTPSQRHRRSRFDDADVPPVSAPPNPRHPSVPPAPAPVPSAPAVVPASVPDHQLAPPPVVSNWYRDRDPRRPAPIDLTGGPPAGRGREATLPAWMTAGPLATTVPSAAQTHTVVHPAHGPSSSSPADTWTQQPQQQQVRTEPPPPPPRTETRQPEVPLKPSAGAESQPEQREQREQREPCKICRGRTKKVSCTNDNHKNGCLVRPAAQGPAGSVLPLSDAAQGIDSAKAKEQAAADLLRAVGCVDGVHCGEEEREEGGDGGNGVCGALLYAGLAASVAPPPTPPSASGIKDSQAVSLAPTPAFSGHRRVPDDIAAEHRRYANKQSGPAASSSSSSSSSSSASTGAVIYSRTGVWGRITASAGSKQGPGTGQGTEAQLGGKMELVRLGEREEDPRKRLEQTRRSSLGAFAQSAALEAAKLRHSPPSASMRPAKGALKAHNGNGASGAAHRPVQWSDTIGKELYVRHHYEGGDYESSSEVARNAF